MEVQDERLVGLLHSWAVQAGITPTEMRDRIKQAAQPLLRMSNPQRYHAARALERESRNFSNMVTTLKKDSHHEEWVAARDGLDMLVQMLGPPFVPASDGLTQEQRTVLTRWCQWNLGDDSWAQQIFEVLEDPEGANAELDAEESS